MKKNGFTLVEVLAVIVILGVITAIAAPAVMGVIDRSKENMYNNQLEVFKDAAAMYVADNINTNPSMKIDGYSTELDLSEMIDYGYIEGPVKNPLTGEYFETSGCMEYYVRITREANAIFTYQVVEGEC